MSEFEDVTRVVAEAGIDVPDDAVAVVVHDSLERGRKIDVLTPGDKAELREDGPTSTRVYALINHD